MSQSSSQLAESALTKCKKLVYQHRIRLRPLFVDFDKLRTGKLYENHFQSALSLGGLHKFLAPEHLQAISEPFRQLDFDGHKGDKLWKVDYVAFLAEVEKVFGEMGLEKDPLKEVAPEPGHLINRQRHQAPTKVLAPEQEARVQRLLARLSRDCNTKGILVKQVFHDVAHAPRLRKIVNHVSVAQFQQGLCSLRLAIDAEDAKLLADKFAHEELADLVNYALFSAAIDSQSHTQVPTPVAV